MNYVYLKIPRFDGRKTLAFNGLVFIAACGGLAWSVAGGSSMPVSDTALYLLAVVAAVNGLLRLVTERPVWWRQMQWSGWDLASGESETAYFTGGDTVYHKAAEFVMTSDFTDWNDREQSQDRLQREYTPPRILPYVDFQRDLDRQLCDARAELPLDAEETRN